MTARLVITDGTETISLLGSDGYILASWRPSIAGYKGGGVFQSSSLSDGRRLVQKAFDNVVERFDLKAKGIDQDTLIRTTQELRRLLEKAAQYWTTDWQDEPVWIEARATGETNTRYAHIHTGMIPEDENPFSQPFLQSCGAVMDNLTLMVERGHWGDEKPGTGTCVEISGLQENWGVGTSDATFAPSAGTDDAYTRGDGIIFTVATSLSFGLNISSNALDSGIRFRNVTIPAGAIITSAYIQFVSVGTTALQSVNVTLRGEDDATPAAFSTYADFWNRVRTGAEVEWNDVSGWILGTAYDSPDIESIVQEIVDRGDWASGNDLVIFVEENGSDIARVRSAASFENVTYTEPQLIVDYIAAPEDFGHDATCLDEVYVANKKNEMQLTSAYYWDSAGTAWSGNLIGSALPYDLLPTPPAIGDFILFGIDSAQIGSNLGVFSSLVFDIIAHAGVTGTDWRYSDSGSGSVDPTTPWASLVEQDNTNAAGAMTGNAFDTSGVSSVHWNQPSDWVTRNPQEGANPALGITAYWIAMVVTNVVAGTPPQQQNRDVYTITWPHVNIDEAQIPGDISPLARIKFRNRSDAAAASPALEIDRCLMALRSSSRGTDFTPYINIDSVAASAQNPDWVTITLGAEMAMAVDTEASIGRSATYTAAATPDALAEEITIEIEASTAPQYIGRFHAYARVDQTVGVIGDVGVQFRATLGSTSVYKSKTQYPTSTSAWQVLDFGSFDMLSSMFDANNLIRELSFELWIEGDATDDAMVIYDFAVMPTDELFLDILNPMNDGGGSVEFDSAMGWSYLLDVDSVTFPKRDRALNREPVAFGAAVPSIITPYRFIAPGHLVLQANTDQRIFFLTTRRAGADDWRAEPAMSHTVQVSHTARYLSMRGNR